MNGPAPLPPSTTNNPDPMGPPIRFGPPNRRFHHPVALWAFAFAIAAAIAGTSGTGLGLLVADASAGDCSGGDLYCGLGAAVLGVFVAAVVAAITYTVAGVVTIRRYRGEGARAAHIAAHLATPPAIIIVLAVLGALSEGM